MSHKGKNITPLRIAVSLIKIVLLVFALRHIYLQIFVKQDTSLLLDQLKSAISEREFYIFLIPAILLVPVNWFIETRKWQLLVGQFEEQSFFSSLKAVLTGLNVGIMTPARVGEFAGRVMYLEPENRLKGIMASFLGSVSQLGTTLIFGLISAWILLPGNFSDGSLTSYLIGLNLIIIPAILIFYFLFNKKHDKEAEPKSKLGQWLVASSLYDRITRFKVLILSFLRYSVFTTQFVFLIMAFGGKVSFFQAFGHAAMTFLGMTLIPTFAMAEAGIRGSIAIEIFGLMEINPLGILSASVLLWTINLMIPTFFGMYFMLKFKLKKSE